MYTDDQGTQVPVHFTKCTLSNDILKYVVVDKSGTDISTYKQHLKRPEELDISTIPIKPADNEKSLFLIKMKKNCKQYLILNL